MKWSLWEDNDVHSNEYTRSRRNHNLNSIEEDESNSSGSDSPEDNGIVEITNERPDCTRNEESPNYNNSGGYIKVFYYFYQAVFLIRLSSFVSSSSFPNTIITLLTPLLNFQFNSIWSCAGEDLRPVKKVFQKNSVAFWVLGLCLVLYGAYKCLKKWQRKTTDDEPGFQARSFPVRLTSTVLHVILFSYIAQTQLAVQLLDCVKVGDENVLFIDGSVTCYKPFQIFGWLYLILHICLLPLAVFFGRILLTSDQISHRHFIASCFFPFFFLCYWVFKYYQHFKGNQTWPQLSDVRTRKPNPFKEKIEYILQYPYMLPEFPNNPTIIEKCSNNWEAILMFRRLILVLVFIFVNSFLVRAYLFFIISTLFLLSHVFVQPYKNEKVNKLDNVSLAVIVMISGLSIAEASYNNAGQLLPNEVAVLPILQDWFLALIPFALLCIFVSPRAKYHYILWRRSTRHQLPTNDVPEVVSNPITANETVRRETSALLNIAS